MSATPTPQKPQRRIKKSKEALQLQESVKHTLNIFQKEAERSIYLTIPEQIGSLQALGALPYLQPAFEERYIGALAQLQPLGEAELGARCLASPAFLMPAPEFSEAERLLSQKVNELSILINVIRRSVETLQWKRKTVVQEGTQQLVIQQLKVSEQNLNEMQGLFVQYHDTRADIVYACQKHRLVDHYLVLLTMEKKVCRALREFVKDFVVHLTMLYQILVINFDKISGAQKQASSLGGNGLGMMM